jgi:hypothetical protein
MNNPEIETAVLHTKQLRQVLDCTERDRLPMLMSLWRTSDEAAFIPALFATLLIEYDRRRLGRADKDAP